MKSPSVFCEGTRCENKLSTFNLQNPKIYEYHGYHNLDIHLSENNVES